MIYTMPYNETITTAMAKQETSEQMQSLLDRIALGLENKGYVLGELRVFLGPMNEIMVDSADDRDPKGDWEAFAPVARTPAEAQEKTDLDQINLALPNLRAGTATAQATQKAVAWLIRRELARMNGGGSV